MSVTRSILRKRLRKRRGVLTVLLVLGIPLLALGWLRSGDIRPAADPTYREAVVGQPTRINPLATATNQAEADLAQLIFSGLMRLRADGLPEPDLAERWEVTPDALTYTFHLRSNATWHDGAAVTADDVAFTIARIQAEDFAGPAVLRADWVDVQVFVADARTILLRLPEPAADFLTRATLGILPAHLVDEMSADSPTRPLTASRSARAPTASSRSTTNARSCATTRRTSSARQRSARSSCASPPPTRSDWSGSRTEPFTGHCSTTRCHRRRCPPRTVS